MRSMLFVPADSERKMARSLESEADALILDLEDSVAAERRPVARELTAAFIADTRAKGARAELWVRINPLDSADWEKDLAGVMPAAPAGIILPKPSSGDDVHKLSVALTHAESALSLKSGSTRILPIVTEVPLSVLQLHTYVGSSTRLAAMSWGAEDLGAVIGSLANRDETGSFTSPYRLVRDLCLITASAAGPEPMDTVYVDFRDDKGLERTAGSRRLCRYPGGRRREPRRQDDRLAAPEAGAARPGTGESGRVRDRARRDRHIRLYAPASPAEASARAGAQGRVQRLVRQAGFFAAANCW